VSCLLLLIEKVYTDVKTVAVPRALTSQAQVVTGCSR